jgi:hypothetical protein
MRGLIKKGIDAYLDLKSFKTNRCLVIIESDDWGSLRTKNKITREKLNAISPAVKNDRFVQIDSLANADDLSALFEVLHSVKDSQGNPACITANVCTANPDFDAIKALNFSEFKYIPFSKTLQQFSKGENLFSLWQNGENQKVFAPQLHGREHLHALEWLAELKAGNKELLKAFDLETWGIPYNAILKKKRKNLQAALDNYYIQGEAVYHKEWIKDSQEIFEQTFGYSSKSFIAPAYTWHSKIHKNLAEAKVKTLQGIKLQYEPKEKNLKYSRKIHYTGEIDRKSGLIYTTRNVFFEPVSKPYKDWINFTLQGIDKAFKNNQPAIIGSHRINYIGSLEEDNRTKNLRMLQTILQKAISKYPNIEFISSNQLASLII